MDVNFAIKTEVPDEQEENVKEEIPKFRIPQTASPKCSIPIAPDPKSELRCTICNFPLAKKSVNCNYEKALLKKHFTNLHINISNTSRDALHFFITWVDEKGYVCPFCPQFMYRVKMEDLCKHIHTVHMLSAERIAGRMARFRTQTAANKKFNSYLNSYQCSLCHKSNRNLKTLSNLEFHILFKHRQEFVHLLHGLQPMTLKKLDSFSNTQICGVCRFRAVCPQELKLHTCSVHLWCPDPLVQRFNPYIQWNGSGYSCPFVQCTYVANLSNQVASHIQHRHPEFAQTIIRQASSLHVYLRAQFYSDNSLQSCPYGCSTKDFDLSYFCDPAVLMDIHLQTKHANAQFYSDNSLQSCPYGCSTKDFDLSYFCDPAVLMDIHLQTKHANIFKSILSELKLSHLLKLKGLGHTEEKCDVRIGCPQLRWVFQRDLVSGRITCQKQMRSNGRRQKRLSTIAVTSLKPKRPCVTKGKQEASAIDVVTLKQEIKEEPHENDGEISEFD